MGMPIFEKPAGEAEMSDALLWVMQSIAESEDATAMLIQAEADKVDTMTKKVEAQEVTGGYLLSVNESVSTIAEQVAEFETILLCKLKIASEGYNVL